MVFNTVALFWSLIPAKGSSTEGVSYKFVDNNVQKRKPTTASWKTLTSMSHETLTNQ
jgi:hypothetical protein